MSPAQGFYVPLLRHLWWWLGTRSADKHTMHGILQAGGTVVVIPGGVQECAFLERGQESVFLKSRKGFVRIAMQHGELRPDSLRIAQRAWSVSRDGLLHKDFLAALLAQQLSVHLSSSLRRGLLLLQALPWCRSSALARRA